MIGAGAGHVVSPFASAPCSNKNFVAYSLLLPTAQLMGFPYMDTFSILQPFSRKYLIIYTLFWFAAICKVPISPSFVEKGETPSSSTKYFTKSKCLCSIAVKKGVLPYLSLTL